MVKNNRMKLRVAKRVQLKLVNIQWSQVFMPIMKFYLNFFPNSFKQQQKNCLNYFKKDLRNIKKRQKH